MENSAHDEKKIIDITQKVLQRKQEEERPVGSPEQVFGGWTSESIKKALDNEECGDGWLLESLLKDKYCYDHSTGTWFRWNGVHWEQDRVYNILKELEVVIDEYGKEAKRQAEVRVEAAEVGDGHRAKEAKGLEDRCIGRISELQRVSRRERVLKYACSGDNSLAVTGLQWDANPSVFGCKNGVLDLTTGEFREGRPQDYLLKHSPVEWKDLYEEAPVWVAFLTDVFDGDMELIDYVQRLVGYAISSQGTEHIFPVLWGEGRNGKTTFLETIKFILGPMAGPIPAEMVLSRGYARSSGSATPELMDIRGKRIVWASETDEGRQLDIGKVKWLSGGDTIIARPLYGKPVEFHPTHTLFLITNHKPRLASDEYAMWKRLHLIPFLYKFEDEPDPNDPFQKKRDGMMEIKLREEASGILAWAVRGLLDYRSNGGLRVPKVVLEATKEYQSEEDILGHFIEDCCYESIELSVRSLDLYAGYKQWCEENGHAPVSSTKFGRRMSRRYSKDRGSGGHVYYYGLRLHSDSKNNRAICKY